MWKRRRTYWNKGSACTRRIRRDDWGRRRGAIEKREMIENKRNVEKAEKAKKAESREQIAS
jgi:hypothetical protein